VAGLASDLAKTGRQACNGGTASAHTETRLLVNVVHHHPCPVGGPDELRRHIPAWWNLAPGNFGHEGDVVEMRIPDPGQDYVGNRLRRNVRTSA
jgi:hypothetical protein